MKKHDILETIISELNKNAKAYDYNVGALDADNNLDDNTLIEIDDISQKDQSTDIADDLNKQAITLGYTINTIKTYQAVSQSEIAPGALVETDDIYLLVGVSFAPLHANNKKAMGITEDAAAYSSLKGKTKGDTIALGNKTYTILDVS